MDIQTAYNVCNMYGHQWLRERLEEISGKVEGGRDGCKPSSLSQQQQYPEIEAIVTEHLSDKVVRTTVRQGSIVGVVSAPRSRELATIISSNYSLNQDDNLSVFSLPSYSRGSYLLAMKDSFCSPVLR